MPHDDLFEVEELERAAEWRLRKVDVDPTDATSRAAAVRLEVLAGDVRRMRDSPLFREYMANDYRARIGVDRSPENGEAYLRALIDLAKQTFGAG